MSTKLTIFAFVCLILAASSLTSCFAARGLPHSLPSDKISSETTIIKSNKVNDVDSTQSTTSSTLTSSDEEVTNSDWEELSEEEFAACIQAGAETETGKSSRPGFEVERPCRRMLESDYGPASINMDRKDGGEMGGDYSYQEGGHHPYHRYHYGGHYRRRLHNSH
ncbi:unnamed protein product [Calypogeia fissa]